MSLWKKKTKAQKLLSNSVLVNNAFYLTEKEKALADAFSDKHKETCTMGFSYIFKHNQIGNITIIQCDDCGTKLNITDFDKW